MKKLSKNILLFIFLIFNINYSYAYIDCGELKNRYENIMDSITEAYNKYLYTSYNDENRDSYYENYKYLLNKGVEIKKSYNSCLKNRSDQISEAEDLFDKGYYSYNKGDYNESVIFYEKYLIINNDSNDENHNKAINNLVLGYNKIAYAYYNKENFVKSIEYYKKVINYKPNNVEALWGLGLIYYKYENYNIALKYYNEALSYSYDTESINSLKDGIKQIEEAKNNAEVRKNAPTNDPLSGYQYYLSQLNIPNAWKKIKNNNDVIVAIIDDGININHPDLTNNIWINPSSKYGESKIIDFVGDGWLDNASTGEHGTMIAGIIGAEKNNKEGIAGISNNIKLMPLRVFGTGGLAKEENIIKALNYAIDNGANIINLSLGLNQFSYSENFDEIIKKAYKNGVIVVIAAGNGDILANKENGVNLDINPISPVCNNEDKYKYSIGVYATDETGYRTNWTNYGRCAQFFAPGVNIISTSIPMFNSNYGTNYNMADGTSFSAPIITGIIALGYNQYGYVDPAIIYDSLEESKIKDTKVGYKIDASKYIDILGKKVNLIKKGELIFKNLKTKLDKTTKYKREKTYKSLLSQLNGVKGKITGDKAVIINQLIVLIEKELGN
ncbi:S8 family serine peptidase [Candidatus Gracilibacteria bacterium]|nr:S8 family serine peptidase [Candidatus Gracilibacteria bacterium]